MNVSVCVPPPTGWRTSSTGDRLISSAAGAQPTAIARMAALSLRVLANWLDMDAPRVGLDPLPRMRLSTSTRSQGFQAGCFLGSRFPWDFVAHFAHYPFACQSRIRRQEPTAVGGDELCRWTEGNASHLLFA